MTPMIGAAAAAGISHISSSAACSKSRVKPLSGRAHGPLIRSTPCSAHATRGSRAVMQQWCWKKLRWRQVSSFQSCGLLGRPRSGAGTARGRAREPLAGRGGDCRAQLVRLPLARQPLITPPPPRRRQRQPAQPQGEDVAVAHATGLPHAVASKGRGRAPLGRPESRALRKGVEVRLGPGDRERLEADRETARRNMCGACGLCC